MKMIMLIDSNPILFQRHVFSGSHFHTARHASEYFSTSFLIDVLYLHE
jgi:hypothetical protein